MGFFHSKSDDNRYDDEDYQPSENYGPSYTPTEAALIRIADALEKIAISLQTLPNDQANLITSLEKIESNIRTFSDDGK